ncbi:MAG: hypothetical protein ABSB26_02140 [Nitrososphaerales archaeon]
MKKALAAFAVALVIILSVATGYFVGVSTSRTSLTTTTTHISTTRTSVLNNEAHLMNVNGSYFWADDVSKDIVVGMPGYSYFLNTSVTFDGVAFTTICPPIYHGCPVPSGTTTQSQTQTTLWDGAIRFNMTFPDKSSETVGNVIGDSIYMFVLSQHYPKAGILVEYVNDFPHNSVGYAMFLLVSSCNASPHLC